MTTPSKPYHLLNINLAQGDRAVPLGRVSTTLEVSNVVPVYASALIPVGPVLVLQIARPLPPSELHRLAMRLDRGVIAQYTNGVGSLEGPEAAECGPFDPAQFLMLDGTRAEVDPDDTLPGVAP